MPPNPQFGDKINLIAKRLLRTMKIICYLNDSDVMCCIQMTDGAFRSTRSRPTNDHVVSNASDVKADEDITLCQSLCARFRSDVVGKKGLCHAGLNKGLFITSHLTTGLVPPSIADLILGTVWTDDFDEESGSVDIAPVIEMSHLILSNDLATRWEYSSRGKPDLARSLMPFATREFPARHLRNQILK
jgi:hypothetical protein